MNIVLIGMSGAGKSTLGVLLAKALGMNYVDTDIVIQNQEERLLQDILAEEGVSKFMEIEERVVSGLELENSIISTGGSVIYSEKAMNSLKQDGQIIYLQLPYEELERRLGDITTRGIVIKEGQSLKDVFDERVPLYIRYSDTILDCSNKSIEDCVSELIEIIQ
ncbi:shikimate kinase [Paenibacillus sp. An7]|uniref:shikimate kinase n=1 Tax=Paenibacillus sp. An7 TaxID=2689577 RepID=UPI00135BEF3B|nr:shikimate kinase [Paenibacillus sp. An7]